MKNFEIENNILTLYKGNDKTVVIPVIVQIIGESAFYSCSSI